MANNVPSKQFSHGENIVRDLKEKNLLKAVLSKGGKRNFFNLFKSNAVTPVSVSEQVSNANLPEHKNTKK